MNAATYERALDAVATLSDRVHGLETEVDLLKGRLNEQASAQVRTDSALQQQAQAQQTAREQTAQAAAAIQTIPAQVASAVEAAKPKTDAFYYKGVSITPTGFLEAANQYRSRALGSDMFSPFNAIPFASSPMAHESEDRLSARQSRLGLLVQGDVDPTTHLAAYGEIDFLGAAQSANSNESNSFTPRLRNLYVTSDWETSGWHLLAGQAWSLATLNGKGITPRNEIIPPQIDAQFIPGFVWTRQPQFRVTKDFGKKLWLAVSVENPQTVFAGALPPNVIDQITNSTGLFAGAVNATAPVSAGGGTPVTPTAATSSLNHLPDVVVKAAYEASVYGRNLHLELFGLGRAFTDRIGAHDDTVYGGGVGGGLAIDAVPGVLDLQLSALSGSGIGRYGTSQLPDVTFAPDGRIAPISETAWLAGGTLHATHALDVYAFAGEEIVGRKSFNATFGYGNPLLDLQGCSTLGGSCSAVTKSVLQGTIGFWQTLYQGSFGRAEFGMQYSYTERSALSGLGGVAPSAADHIVFTSVRFYPF
ncbi:hypothetical protein [Phenylobacterium sp.]|uniref:hypothetical protein n=1 Tax=Phenylobacterium sp. TaxID=1871053 RepID=UPI001205FE43|nr:hypothetical protein [Phenylobacterium sp.]THD57513.1 MAG: hypothetical protein E8A12_13310 [Phenylobacterium sp.]